MTHIPEQIVIGLMSGTSMDAIDAACIRVQFASHQHPTLAEFEILGTHTESYEPDVIAQLQAVLTSQTLSLDTLCELNQRIGQHFARTAQVLNNTLKQPADLIASHGQTLYHIPPTVSQHGTTLQLGDPTIIREQLNTPVVADFRLADMAAGGQGAPLIPFADQLLFQDDHKTRAVQNIGGIGNVTVIPPNGSSKPILGFDTGPGNMIMDALMQHYFDTPYDTDGNTAAKGTVIAELLTALLTHPFFSKAPPKSTGRETFGLHYVKQHFIAHQESTKCAPEDLVATATELTALSIAHAYEQFILTDYPIDDVIIGGGGLRNATLMHRLDEHLQAHNITRHPHEHFGIPSQYKEAIGFALLGYATAHGIPNNIPSCTGASKALVLGGHWH